MLKSCYKLAIIAPTCFYYQEDLFRQLNCHPRIDLTVYFCSEEALDARDAHVMYQTIENWGDRNELLNGYKYKFLKNSSPRPSYLKWPHGLMNFSIWDEIEQERPDLVVLMSWMNITWWIAIAACVRFHVPFLYMTDANIAAESYSSGLKKAMKQIVLGNILFKLATGFLCAGYANRKLYQFYGVPDRKLIPFAYSWGYKALLETASQLKPRRSELKAKQGLSDDSVVILYCGRLGEEKALFDLLNAYQLVGNPNKHLAIVGEGNIGQSLRDYATNQNINSIRFWGFRKRHEIAEYYATADVLVLPSRRETWGIVVSEAMCFELPVIVSDQVGAAPDMVREGENGFTFPTGDIQALADRIRRVIDLPTAERRKMGLRPAQLMDSWSSRDLVKSLDQYLDLVHS